jgi:dynein heavy chain 2
VRRAQMARLADNVRVCPQLSAVSQQIQVIQAALKAGEPSCSLLGKEIEVNANAAIFVTLNPASKE